MSNEVPPWTESEADQTQKWEGGCLWVGVGVILGGLALGLLFVGISWTRSSRLVAAPEPLITIVEAATDTPDLLPTHTQEPAQIPMSTESPGVQLGTDFSMGDIIDISGTGGQGLSLRNEPSLSSTVDSYGMESEIFEIKGGPIEADGYRWWFLVSPYDSSKKGWGVGVYLRGSSP